MKSIAFNDTSAAADEEGFVIVDTPPHEFDSPSGLLLEDDEESYDHCDDAFSFSSLHQTMPVSSIPMESVQDDFFEHPLGQEVVPPAVPSSPSLLSEDDDDDDPPVFAMEDSPKLNVIIPHIDSEVERLCALVSSLPSSPNSLLGAMPADCDDPVAELSANSIPNSNNTDDNAETTIDSYSTGVMIPSQEDKTEEDNSVTPSSSSASGDGATTTTSTTDDDKEDDVDSAGTDNNPSDHLENRSIGRVSKKKRRKQLKIARKAAAAAAAAAALGHGLSMRSTPKRKGKNRKKVANIAVSCAVQSIAEYKEEVERAKIVKKIR